jgi:hypothetical protein
MFKKLGWMVLVVLSASSWGYAQEPVMITGTKIQTIQPTVYKQQGRSLSIQGSRPRVKRVSMLKLSLTRETKNNLAQRITGLVRHPNMTPTAGHYPRTVQLGMNAVPVLDQGEHGSCMTFASTAAVDAAIGKGDYVSQLCQLDLNQYLNHNAFVQRNWEGGWGQDLFSQITMFGIVPKAVQTAGGCLGRVDYPLSGEEVTDELSVFDYHQISEPIQDYGLSFNPLILKEQINSNLSDRERILYQIKSILRQGERVTCSVILMGQLRYDDTPTGSHHVTKDTWVLLPQMADELADDEESSGHAFVITGYDDDGIAVDATGQFHRGLLTLRNSWGSSVGDQGDFYMTYSYFKAALLEAHHVKRMAGADSQ